MVLEEKGMLRVKIKDENENEQGFSFVDVKEYFFDTDKIHEFGDVYNINYFLVIVCEDAQGVQDTKKIPIELVTNIMFIKCDYIKKMRC